MKNRKITKVLALFLSVIAMTACGKSVKTLPGEKQITYSELKTSVNEKLPLNLYDKCHETGSRVIKYDTQERTFTYDANLTYDPLFGTYVGSGSGDYITPQNALEIADGIKVEFSIFGVKEDDVKYYSADTGYRIFVDVNISLDVEGVQISGYIKMNAIFNEFGWSTYESAEIYQEGRVQGSKQTQTQTTLVEFAYSESTK